MSPYNYTHLRPPPKSKSAFYATSPHWRDVKPIPLVTHQPNVPDPGPALATIAYSPRYTEAMEYLRGVMAVNEASERVLALTEDVIGMNPAHYTVWGFRMMALRKLWEGGDEEGRVVEEGDDESGDVETRLKEGVERELDWLEGVSERNLKNYQIWHHRQQLLSVLPLPETPSQISETQNFLSTTEIPFLTHILSFDAKNYHVWTYRQWLCRRYAHFLLSPLPDSSEDKSSEIIEIEKLIEEDIRNNSAYSHRYFCVFGYEEIEVLESADNLDQKNATPLIRKDLFTKSNGGTRPDDAGNLLAVDPRVRDREIAWVKSLIARTPQNPSCWNYLKGVAQRCDVPVSSFTKFCESFVRPADGSEPSITPSTPLPHSTTDPNIADDTQPLDFLSPSVRSSHAIALLADIHSARYISSLSSSSRGESHNPERDTNQSTKQPNEPLRDTDEQARDTAEQAWRSLGQKWDPIRRNYWEWRIQGMGVGKIGVGL